MAVKIHCWGPVRDALFACIYALEVVAWLVLICMYKRGILFSTAGIMANADSKGCSSDEITCSARTSAKGRPFSYFSLFAIV